MGAPTFPTLFTRAGLGVPLENAQMDSNWTNIRSYCLTLANLIANSLNPDGTLTNNSVGTAALQQAAVTLANLNPALLYSIIPVDTDTGTPGAYAITAQGGLGGSNVIPGGATYDANGNYVVSNLTLNFGYYWVKGAHDTSVIVNSQTTITATGSFTAIATSVTLTGTPSATVTATLAQAAPIAAYKNGQMFFVYTASSNPGAATLNVNNLGAIPILLSGQPLSGGVIAASSVFAVVYQSGSFVLFSGGGSGGATASEVANFTFNGTTLFSTGQTSLPGSGTTKTIAHGFGVVPQSYQIFLQKIASDSTTPAIGEYVSADQFTISSAAAFLVTVDATSITVKQGASATPSLFGTAITAASWKLVVDAVKQTNVSNLVFPALTYMLATPAGAYSYQNNLVMFNLGKTSGVFNGACVNMTNNEITMLTTPSAGVPAAVNIALFKRASGLVDAILATDVGIYRVPASNPVVSVVPQFATYDSSGNYSFTITASTAYTLTQGANDISWTLNGSTSTTWPGSIASGNTYTTLTLSGNPGGSVTASVTGTAATWQPVELWAYPNYEVVKPVWIVESGGNITDIYAVTSCLYTGAGSPGVSHISAITMFHANVGTNAAYGTALDFTSSGITNIAALVGTGKMYTAGSSAPVLLFQYNPITQRIYIMTTEMGLMHIFSLSSAWAAGNGSGAAGNDISAFWNASSRYPYLSYVKSIALGGDGAVPTDGHYMNITVEFDQNSGLEVATVINRRGDPGTTGSVTRIPWVE